MMMVATSSKCKCLYKFFRPSSKGDTAALDNVLHDDGNTEVLAIQSKENGRNSNNILEDGEKSVLSSDHSKKLSAHHRLKIWIISGHSGIIRRYGKKLELDAANVPKQFPSEHVNTVWPDWLMNVAPEAVQGWFPRRAESFEKLSKIGQGTYSSVYKARDLKTGKIVALKKVRFVNLDPESVRFMAREILVLRKLNHPNVIKLEGIITSSVSKSLYLVFEYMETLLVLLQLQASSSVIVILVFQLTTWQTGILTVPLITMSSENSEFHLISLISNVPLYREITSLGF